MSATGAPPGASNERSRGSLPPTPNGLDRKGSYRPPLSEASASSLASLPGEGSLLRASSSMSNRGGIQLDRSRRATVLNDKYILGEELGRGAYGQARAPVTGARKSGWQKRRSPGRRAQRCSAASACLSRRTRAAGANSTPLRALSGAPRGCARRCQAWRHKPPQP